MMQMRAITVAHAGADARITDEPRPEPGPDDILVRIHAAGYNPFDMKVATGMVSVGARFPLILGTDGAGVVAARGEQVTEFAVGDRVFGQFSHLREGLGSYAEYGIAGQFGAVAAMPQSMSFAVGAALPIAAGTAYDLVDQANVGPGQTVLINGATGGVGQFATQMATGEGADVIATVTAETQDLLAGLGASETVDFTKVFVPEAVKTRHPNGVDVVFDVVSKPDSIGLFADLVRPGGVIISTLGSLDPEALATRKILGINLGAAANPAKLADIARLVDSGKLRVHISNEVPLERAPDALAKLTEIPATGKTVFVID
jgi:NADPH:quinone reductase-like Zn-dependent oxidoreductase